MTDSIDYDANYGFGIGRTYTRVRGGGAAGGRAWVAQITGYDPNSKWKLIRRFCVRDTSDLSGSGRSGRIRFAIDEPGLYEYADFAYKSRYGCRGFFLIEKDGTVSELERSEALELAKAMGPEMTQA